MANPALDTYNINYLSGSEEKTISVQFNADHVLGLRTAVASVRALSKLPSTSEVFNAILTQRDLLSIEVSVGADSLESLQETSDLIANPDTTLKDLYTEFMTETSNPNDEMEWMTAFGADLPPYVLVTDDAIAHTDEDSIDNLLNKKEMTTDLISISSKDASRTIAVKNIIGSDFEVGFLYFIKLAYSVYNLNFTDRATKPVIYGVKLNSSTALNGFIKSSALSVNANQTSRLQY